MTDEDDDGSALENLSRRDALKAALALPAGVAVTQMGTAKAQNFSTNTTVETTSSLDEDTSRNPDKAAAKTYEYCGLIGAANQRTQVDASEDCSLIYQAPDTDTVYYSPIGIEGWYTASQINSMDGYLNVGDEAMYPSSTLHAWRYDEGSGNTVTDEIASADGSVNGPSWVSDSMLEGDYGLQGNGSSDDVQVDAADIDESSSHLTDGAVSVAFTITDYGGENDLKAVMGNNVGSNEGILVHLNRGSAGTIEFSATDNNTASIFVRTDNPHITDSNTLYRVVAGKSGNTDGDVEIYINNTEASGYTVVSSGTLLSFTGISQNLLYFARNNGGTPDNHIPATLDWPVIYQDSPSNVAQADYDLQPWS